MTKTKHPKDRLERIKVREKKEKQDSGTSCIRRQKINEIRQQEAEDALKTIDSV